jgi:hypothetical protein
MNVQTKIESHASEQLPLAALQQLLEKADAQAELAAKEAAKVRSEIAKRVASIVAQARELAGKNEGSIRVVVEGCEVKSSVPKKVSYDNDGLMAVAREMGERGIDPTTYIKFEAKISERVYETMPDALKELCAPHRTLSHGKEAIEVTIV